MEVGEEGDVTEAVKEIVRKTSSEPWSATDSCVVTPSSGRTTTTSWRTGESVAQSAGSGRRSEARWSVAATWVVHRHVLGFAPAS